MTEFSGDGDVENAADVRGSAIPLTLWDEQAGSLPDSLPTIWGASSKGRAPVYGVQLDDVGEFIATSWGAATTLTLFDRDGVTELGRSEYNACEDLSCSGSANLLWFSIAEPGTYFVRVEAGVNHFQTDGLQMRSEFMLEVDPEVWY